MEFYISPQRGQFYMVNVLENQWLSVTYNSLLHTVGAFVGFVLLSLLKKSHTVLVPHWLMSKTNFFSISESVQKHIGI